MNCPHCGADKLDGYNRFACSTRQDSKSPTYICLKRQISQLKAELEQAKADRARAAMQERNKYLAKLSQCVRRNDPRLMAALRWFNDRNHLSEIAGGLYDVIKGK